MSELLAGASIALPSEVNTILKLLRIGSRIMYAFFTAGTVVNFCLMFASPLVIRTRWFTLPIAVVAFISTILVGVAAIIATAISLTAKFALTAQDELNIQAEIGIKMMVFVWISAICTFIAFILHAAMGCCCRPQRLPKGGDSAGSYEMAPTEKSGSKLPGFMRRRRPAHTDGSDQPDVNVDVPDTTSGGHGHGHGDGGGASGGHGGDGGGGGNGGGGGGNN